MKAISKKKNSSQFYWHKLFIEVVTRALRKAHIDYQIISSGQNNISTDTLSRINSGVGIELVPEETVRDYIINELLIMGIWKKQPIENKERSYWINREVQISIKKCESTEKLYKSIFSKNEYARVFPEDSRASTISYRVDMSIERFRDKIGNNEFSPVLLELKRFRTKKIILESGGKPYQEGEGINTQVKEIKQDIKKLKFIRECISQNQTTNYTTKDQKVIISVLTWGVLSHRDEIFKIREQLNIPERDFEIRCFPTEWNKDGKSVTKWCVVGLGEIDSHLFP